MRSVTTIRSQTGSRRGPGEGEDLTLDRAHRRVVPRGGQPFGRRPRSGGEDHVARTVLGAVGRAHPDEPVVLDQRPGRLGDLDRPALRLERCHQRRGERPRVDRRLVRSVNATVAAGAEARLERRGTPKATAIPRRGRARASARSGGAARPPRRGRGRRAARPARGSPDRAARRCKLGGERRPELVRGERQLEQAILAPARLADRREHAGGDVRGARRQAGRARAPSRRGRAGRSARRRRGRSRPRRR